VSAPLNLVYVGTWPPHPGGSAISASQLMLGLVATGSRVRALAPITPDAAPSDDGGAARPGLAVQRFEVPYFETSPNVPAPAAYRRQEGEQVRSMLTALIERERPDAVVIGRETFAWHVPDVAARFGVPSLLRFGGGVTNAILSGAYPEAMGRTLFEAFHRMALIVVQARYLADALGRLGFRHVSVVPNAVDLRQFAPRPKSERLLHELAIGHEDIVVAHVSNLKDVKRPLDLVDSAELAVPADPRLLYLVVGDGPCREAMERACVARGVAHRFRFVGWVDYARIPEFLSLADIVAMPSEHEQQARVYLETQACARLLLASDIPGAREVVTDGETGLLFCKGDPADLAAKTLRAAADPRLRADIGNRARAQVGRHALDTAVSAYATALRGIVRAGPPSR